MSGPFYALAALVLAVLAVVGLVTVARVAPFVGAVIIVLLTWAAIALALEFGKPA